MDYDYRSRTSSPYGSQIPMYGPPATSSSAPSPHPMYGSSAQYPRIGQHSHTAIPSVGRSSSSLHHQTSSSSSSGLGIRVALKPEYRITPPPPLTPLGDVPRSNFQFDFSFERKVLAEAEKDDQNWSSLGLENLPSKTTGSTSSSGSVADPVVRKYIASGLNREAVPIAVANYGDNPTKRRVHSSLCKIISNDSNPCKFRDKTCVVGYGSRWVDDTWGREANQDCGFTYGGMCCNSITTLEVKMREMKGNLLMIFYYLHQHRRYAVWTLGLF